MPSRLRSYEQGPPNHGRRKDFYRSRIWRVEEEAADEAFGAAFYLVDKMVSALADGGGGATEQMIQFVEALRDDLRSMAGSMLSLHERVGEQIQDAIVAAYVDKLATSRNPQGYRAGASDHSRLRYANGVLLEALRSPELIRATYDGIAFPNISLLDRRAEQWHRLNFGAGSAAGAGNRIYSGSFGGLVMAGLGFTDESPSRPFVLPTGFWTFPTAGKNGEFYPSAEGPPPGQGFRLHKGPTATKGIEAWHFLDAGVRTMVDVLPAAWSERFDRLVTDAERGRGAFSRTTTHNIKLPPGGFKGTRTSKPVR